MPRYVSTALNLEPSEPIERRERKRRERESDEWIEIDSEKRKRAGKRLGKRRGGDKGRSVVVHGCWWVLVGGWVSVESALETMASMTGSRAVGFCARNVSMAASRSATHGPSYLSNRQHGENAHTRETETDV